MTDDRKPIADDATDRLSVAPGRPEDDRDETENDRVDIGSEDSMGASDPPSTSAPGSDRGVEQAKEEARQQDA